MMTSTSNKYTDAYYESRIKELFERLKECESFYQLNYFTIFKIAKKYEKILESGGASFDPELADSSTFQYWLQLESYSAHNNSFAKNIEQITLLTDKCKDSYQRICR